MRVLGLFPHPDDEAYAAGAALAQCAAAGLDVRVVSATRGERGRDMRRRSVDPETLARIRSEELGQACNALGVRLEGFLDLPDGRLAEVGNDAVDTAIDGILARVEPDVVVTLGRDGVYGSREHIVLTERLAAIAARRPGLIVLYAAFPVGLFDRVRRKLGRAGLDIDRTTRLGCGAEAVALRVDVGALRQRKLAAIACHRSQLRDDDPLAFLGGGIVEPLLREEWFTTA